MKEEKQYYTMQKIYHKNLIDAIIHNNIYAFTEDKKYEIYIFKDEYVLKYRQNIFHRKDKKIVKKQTEIKQIPIKKYYALIIEQEFITFIEIFDKYENNDVTKYDYKTLFVIRNESCGWELYSDIKRDYITRINDIINSLKKRYKLIKVVKGIKKCEC